MKMDRTITTLILMMGGAAVIYFYSAEPAIDQNNKAKAAVAQVEVSADKK